MELRLLFTIEKGKNSLGMNCTNVEQFINGAQADARVPERFYVDFRAFAGAQLPARVLPYTNVVEITLSDTLTISAALGRYKFGNDDGHCEAEVTEVSGKPNQRKLRIIKGTDVRTMKACYDGILGGSLKPTTPYSQRVPAVVPPPPAASLDPAPAPKPATSKKR